LASVALGTGWTWRSGQTRFTAHSSQTGRTFFSRTALGARRTGFAPHALRTRWPLQSCLSLTARWAGRTRWSHGTRLSGNALRTCCSGRAHRAGPSVACGNEE